MTIAAGATIAVNDGGVVYLDNTITNKGTIALSANSQTTQLRMGSAPTTLTGGGLVLLSDNANNLITGFNNSAELINWNNTIRGAGTFSSETLINQAKGVIDGTGDTAALIINTIGTVTNRGTLESTSGLKGLQIDNALATSGLLLATGTGLVTAYGAITNYGTIETMGSGVLNIENSVFNTGLILVNGGKLQITGSVTGAGKMQIGTGSTLELGAKSGETITFAGAGTLQLDTPRGYFGAIAGLSVGDKIDLGGIAVATKIAVQGTKLIVIVIPINNGTC